MNNLSDTALPRERFLAIDALRTVVLLLLIVYHASVLFQPWSSKLGWIQLDPSITEIWVGMEMLNVWRIPILFWLSGMGVRFAMERRNNRELLKERSLRILLPLVFGYFTFGPLCLALDQYARGEPISYFPAQYHLWFLGNIFVYVVAFLPLLRWIQNRPTGWVNQTTAWLLRTGWYMPLFALPYMLLVPILRPEHFSSYAETSHGFYYGAVCFLLGFLSANAISTFQTSAIRWRWPLTMVCLLLFAFRMVESEENILPHYWDLSFAALESMWWILAILGHAFHRWSNGFRGLRYWNIAVYPVYIFHQPLQNALALLILVASWNRWMKLTVLIIAILLGSLLLFEITRRLRWVRPLVGLKLHNPVKPM